MAGVVATAQNQFAILYPGAGNPSNILQVFSATSAGIQSPTTATVPPGTFRILPLPDGTKYYLLSSGAVPISVMSATFATVTPIASEILTVPSAGALTPDGRKLVVTSGSSVYVVDTSSDTVIANQALTVSGKIVDIAVNFDSSRAFILSRGTVGSAGTILSAVDLMAAVPVLAGTPLTLNGDNSSPATGITVAPNGFIYLANNYRLFEVNPSTLTVTTNGEIPVQAYPDKPFITSDGRFLVCANLRPIQGGTMFVQVNLATKAWSGFNYTNDVISQFFNQAPDSKGNTRLYAASTGGLLYDLTLGVPNADYSQLVNLFPSPHIFGGIQFSAENPPRFMWGTYGNGTSSFLVQADIVNQTFTQLPISNVPQKLGLLAVSPASGGAALRGFNNNQTIQAGTQSARPIVAQLLDSQGRGIFRGLVTFTTTSPGVTLTTPNFMTGSNGYAQTYVIAPTTATGTTFTVTANGGAGVTPLEFNFTVPGPGTGGSQAGLFYVGGNGQLLRESQLMNVPLQVQSLDATGKPLSGIQITWSVDATQLSAGYQTNPSSTDTNGRAQIILQGLLGVSQSGSPTITSNITAADPYGNTVKFVFTTTAVALANGTDAPDPTVGENLLDENGNPVAQFPKGRFITAASGSVVRGAYVARITNTAGPFQGRGIQNVGVCFTNADPNSVDGNPGGTAAVGPTTCGKFPPLEGVSADCTNNPISDVSGLVTCDLKIGAKTGTGRIYPIVGQFKNMPAITLNVTGGPSVVSLTPPSGSGSTQSLTLQFSHQSGYSTLGVLNLLINTALDGRHGCYLAYVQQSNTLYLVNDGGDAGGPYAGAVTLNGSGSVRNSQCTVFGSGSSVAGSGNSLTLTLNMSFTSSFGGNKVVYVAAGDTAQNNSGWQTMGVLSVPPLPATFPRPVSVTPSYASASNSTLGFSFQDVSSAQNLQTGWALVNTSLDGRGACYVAYYRPGNQIFLYPDSGDGTQAVGMVLTGNNTVSNSQCTISAQGSSVRTSGNELTVSLNITFSSVFGGAKAVWMAVQSVGGQTSLWQALGAVRVP